jgi:putative RNA 2'-phosphotransferase
VTRPSKGASALAKFLTYALGRRPDEFGLVADSRGFVPIKELVKALRSEDGWRHLREAHLKEVVLTVVPCPVEMQEGLIRASSRERLPRERIPEALPKLLYIAVRNRAYPTVSEKGMKSGSRPHLVLSSDPGMALKLGSRIDADPVLLTVNVAQSLDSGADYKQYGESLYLADAIPAATFSGPPLPKEKPPANKPQNPQPAPRNPNPGSYFPEFDGDAEASRFGKSKGGKRRKKGADWKKARKMERKHKARQQRH